MLQTKGRLFGLHHFVRMPDDPDLISVDMMADAVLALVGAAYLDGGVKIAVNVMYRIALLVKPMFDLFRGELGLDGVWTS